MEFALLELTPLQIAASGAIFVWSGFVRAGLGFGGAVLSLPLLLMIDDRPLFWLPIIACHLLLFAILTLRSRFGNVDWQELKASLPWIMPAKLAGVLGLVSLPNRWLLTIIYAITIFYALLWITGARIRSQKPWLDRLLLIGGGYFSGTSLSGAPLVVAVYVKRIARQRLRDTLFVLWILLVSIKLVTLAWFGIDLQLSSMLLLVPVTAVGHVIGMKMHESLLDNDQLFKRALGLGLVLIAGLGLARSW